MQQPKQNTGTQTAVLPTPQKSILTSLDDFAEQDAKWLVPNIIPEAQISLICGDGGTGKTSIWASLIASISSGRQVFFDPTPPELFEAEPRKCVFFSGEDSIEIVLRKRLRMAGADLCNILSMSMRDERFPELKFNSQLLKDIILQEKPALAIFDPLQAFVPEGLNLGARNDMRSLLTTLIGLGEEVGTTFVIILHTNKRTGAWGRMRIADSADMWDAARSVMIVGNTGDGTTRYLSNEKNNYSELAQTTLFEIQDGKPIFVGLTEKRDADFVKQIDFQQKQAPQRTIAESFILNYLRNGQRETSELDEAAKAQGISRNTLSRAKQALKETGVLGYRATGYGRDKKWYTYLSG